MKSGSSQEEPLFCHKILTKKCRKPLDFCSRDEYNTLSTQRNGVLNTGSKENKSFRAKKVYHYIYYRRADRVVIKTVEVEETTKGGLILTGSAKEKPQVCEVIAVGPGGVVDGKEVKMTVKVGDKVLTSKYSGTEVKVDGEECTIVRQGDILAVVED